MTLSQKALNMDTDTNHPQSDNSSRSRGFDKATNSLVVILKVHGSAIHLRNQLNEPARKLSAVSSLQSYRIFCHDLDNQSDSPGSSVRVFVLPDAQTLTDRVSAFRHQQTHGEPIAPTDLTMFMSKPFDGQRKASFAIDLGISQHSTSLEDLTEDDCRKLGTAYMYLDPKFATHGIQRMQIIGAHTFAPIGHMQVEYLIVRNPYASDVKCERPEWLSRVTQLDAGHRGAGSGCRPDLPGYMTENTIASFNYAHRHGADMVELDILVTADGIPIVYHNFKLGPEYPDTQIDQLTLKELRNLKDARIHDKNCIHKTSNNRQQPESTTTNSHDISTRPFPTLEEVLQQVDQSCGMNIELKWPQMLANGKPEAMQYREINNYVDIVLNCIFEHANGRHILLSTLNADIAIMLRLKQAELPVLFLTTGDCNRYNDPITKSTKNAILFAKAFDMAGINPNAAFLTEKLVRYAQDRGLLVYAWGKIESPQAVKELRRYGLNGVIYDKIDLIKPVDDTNTRAATNTN